MRLIASLILPGLFMACAAEAGVTAYFEPAQVNVGESSQLIFQSDEPIRQAPDLTGLQKNFVVSGQQQRQFSSTVNGKTEAHYELIYNIFPRSEGQLSTGVITIGTDTIKEATLTVSPTPSTTERGMMRVDASVHPETAYPGETVLYTVKITEAAGLLDGEIRPPVIPNARVSVLDMDKAYQTTVDGKPVRVFERTFGIVPESSGSITIPPTEFYGLIPAQPARQRKDMFDFFEQGILFNGLTGQQKEIFLSSKPTTLTVLPKPAGWTGWWLPSTRVTLQVSDNLPDSLTAGDSIERVFKLTALGVSAEQLPVIQQPASDNLKVYPSPEKRETTQTPNGELQGLEEISVVIVPTQSGTITIPEVKIPWFNTQTRKMETAVIPAKTISVQPAPAETVATVKIPEQALTAAPQPPEPTSPLGPQEHFSELKTTTPGLYWIMALLGIGIIGGFMLGLLYMSGKGRSRPLTPAPRIPPAKKHKSQKKKPVPDLYPF